MDFFRLKNRKILASCILFSLAAHICTIILLQKHSLWFYSSNQSPLKDQITSSEILHPDPNQILKQVFQKIDRKDATLHATSLEHLPMAEASLLQSLNYSTNEIAQKSWTPSPSSLPVVEINTNQFLIYKPAVKNRLQLPIRIDHHDDIVKNLHKYSDRLKAEYSQEALVSRTQLAENQEIDGINSTLSKKADAHTPDQCYSPFEKYAKSKKIDRSVFQRKELAVHEPEKRETAIARGFPDMPSLRQLNTISCGEDFDTDLIFMPKEGESGYIFALTLIPKPNVKFEKIPQNYFFVLDRSNPIETRRLRIVKNAVSRALTFLQEKDSFNILAFDTQIDLFSTNNLECNPDSLKAAKSYLNHLQLGNIFTSANLYKPLYTVLTYPAKEDEVNTIILLTNGDGFDKRFNNRLLLDNWTEESQGKFNLHVISMSSDKNRGLMDFFSSFNGGQFISSSTRRGLKRHLLKLMKSIAHPIIKDVACSAIHKTPSTDIELHTTAQLPNIYTEQPLVIFGSTSKMEDFILFVQGKQNGKWVNIKKKISFLNARKGGKSLREQWAIQRSYYYYERYIADRNPEHLDKARTLLAPYDIEVAF